MNELKQSMAKAIFPFVSDNPDNDHHRALAGAIAQAILDMPEIKQALQNTVALDGGVTMGDASTRKDEVSSTAAFVTSPTNPRDCKECGQSARGGVHHCQPTYTHEQVMRPTMTTDNTRGKVKVPSGVVERALKQIPTENVNMSARDARRIVTELAAALDHERARLMPVLEQVREALSFIQMVGIEPNDLPDNIRLRQSATMATKALAAINEVLKG